jgi:hypothetical protein
MERSGGEDPKLSEVKAVLQRLQRISADQEADPVAAPVAAAQASAWLPLAISFGVACAVVVTVGTLTLTDSTRLTFAFVSHKPGNTDAVDARVAMPAPLPPSAAEPGKIKADTAAAKDATHASIPGLKPAEPGKGKADIAAAGDATPAPSPALKPAEPGKGKADIAAARDVAPAPSAPPAAAAPAPASRRPALERALAQLSAGQIQAARRQLLALSPSEEAEVAWALARSYDPNFLASVPGADATPDIAEATRWYRAWHATAIRDGLVAQNVPLERIIGSMR